MGTGLNISCINRIKELAAEKEYQRALSIVLTQDLDKSFNPEFLRLCGEIFIENQRYDDARKYLIKAHQMSPQGNRIIFEIIRLYLLMGYYKKADVYFEQYKNNAMEDDENKTILEYMFKKAKGCDAKELLATLKPVDDMYKKDHWQYEQIILMLLLGKKKEAEDECRFLEDTYKDSIYIARAKDAIENAKDYRSMIYIYPEHEVEELDIDSPIAIEEADILRQDYLREHPKDPEIKVMADDNDDEITIRLSFPFGKKKKNVTSDDKKPDEKKTEDKTVDQEKTSETSKTESSDAKTDSDDNKNVKGEEVEGASASKTESTASNDEKTEETKAEEKPAKAGFFSFFKRKDKADSTEVEEKPVEEPKAEEKPAEEPKAEEKPAEEPKAEEKPAEEPKVEEKPAEEPKAEEKPAEEPKVEENPKENLNYDREDAVKKAKEAAELAAQKAEAARKAAEEAKARKEAIENARKEAEERRIAEEARKAAEEEARKAAEEEARKAAEEEARKAAEEEVRREAEEEARKAAEEETRKAAEEEARRAAEEEARRAAEEEARKVAEEEARKVAEEAKKTAIEEAKESTDTSATFNWQAPKITPEEKNLDEMLMKEEALQREIEELLFSIQKQSEKVTSSIQSSSTQDNDMPETEPERKLSRAEQKALKKAEKEQKKNSQKEEEANKPMESFLNDQSVIAGASDRRMDTYPTRSELKGSRSDLKEGLVINDERKDIIRRLKERR